MMLLSLHIIAISVLVGAVSSIAYQLGMKEGQRLAAKEQNSDDSN